MKPFLPLLLIPFLVSCSTTDTPVNQPVPEKPPEPPKIVGRIVSIPPERRFVLIQSYGTWAVPAGKILISLGPGDRTANLLFTGETLGQYAAADLQSGSVEVGDAVFDRPPASPSPSQTPEPSQESVENEAPAPAPANN